MGSGIDIKNIPYTDPRFKLYNNLQSDVAKFSAYREARKQKELDAATDDESRKKIEKKYAEWFKTEKQGAFANASAAENWTGFQENADLYPNLQYRTAGDADVRPEHARLEGLILPLNDPFWITHTPPLGFGCRCWVTQTDRGVHRNENYLETKAEPGFDFNPGIEQKIFADSAGYYKGWTHEETVMLDKKAESFSANISKRAISEFVKTIDNEYTLGNEKITLTNHDVNNITGKPHEDRPLRNTLLFDLHDILKNAELADIPVKESKGRKQYDTWYYYRVKGFKNMFLNIVRMTSGELKLHAITDKIK